MPRSHSSQAESSSNIKLRQRVTKACQRCRLKKCKCDGQTPCSRCKSDDAICAYPKHQHFDKIVYRKGYVQMLERQQAQLIAGVQSLHQMIQKGERLPTGALEASKSGLPLVHQILQSLGVLEANDPWDEIDSEGYKPESPESPSPEFASAIDTHFPLEVRSPWPGDVSACSPLETPLVPSPAWGMASTGNATLPPWGSGPYQSPNMRQPRSMADSLHGDKLQIPTFAACALDTPKLDPATQACPKFPTNLVNYQTNWAFDPGDALSMLGEGNGQLLCTSSSKPSIDTSGYGSLGTLR